MFVLGEMFPFLCGITIGYFMEYARSPQQRNAIWLGASFFSGLVANQLNGETWLALFIDIPLVALTALAVPYLQRLTRNLRAR